MILDTMCKNEVMQAIRNDFDNDVLPYYQSTIRLKIQRLIQTRSARLKTTINLGWVEYTSKNRIKYHILQRGDQYEDKPIFISECTWRKRGGRPQMIFASLHPNSTVVVYTQHCLERYAERVLLKPQYPLKEVFVNILKNQAHAFHIVLPSPTHKFTLYHGTANTLFLGDYEPSKSKDTPAHNWYNTCISIKETKESQYKILQSLCKLQCFIEDYKFNPIEDNQRLLRYIKNIKGESDKNRLIEFLQISYMLLQLHLSYQMSITSIFLDEIQSTMKSISDQLNNLGESVEHLSPFDKHIGIANKGELDYTGLM